METNMNAAIHDELKTKGQALLNSAYDFWKVHKSICGPRAVVWLEDDSGHFVLFTRSEYRNQIMGNITPATDETPLNEPFTIEEQKK